MAAKKRGPGRPKGSGTNEETLRLRLPTALRELAADAAKRLGVSESEWWRQAARRALLEPDGGR